MFDFIRKMGIRYQSDTASELEKQLRLVSIRGRVAYCTTCLEGILASTKVGKAEFASLLPCLWEFTSSLDLSEWEEKAMDFYSDSVLSNSEQPATLTIEQLERLRASYADLSASQLTCIDEAIEVGRGNLYAGTGSHSADTLASTMKLVQHMQANGYQLPPINKFLRSPFNQENQHGWGKPVDRSFFN